MSQYPIDAELYEKARSFVQAALAKLIEEAPHFIEYASRQEYQNRGIDVLVGQLDFLASLPEFAVCRNYISKMPNIEKMLKLADLYAPQGSERPLIESVTLRLFSQYLFRARSPVFNQTRFDEAYRRLELILTQGKIVCKALAPILGFDADDEFDVEEGIRVRNILSQDRKIFKRNMDEVHLHYTHTIIDATFEYDVSELGEVEIPEEMGFLGREKIENVLTSLRLFRHGDIGLAFIYAYPDAFVPTTTTVTFTGKQPLPKVTNYVFSRQEISDFVNFYRRFNSLYENVRDKERRIIDLAIGRFNNSYEREDEEDRLIDLMIAFEALYLEESVELGLRLALRTAVMLETDRGRRQETYVYIKEAYNIRSEIVHGNEVGPQIELDDVAIDFHAFNDKIEDYLRRSIIRFIEALQNKSYSSLLKELEGKWFES